MLVLTPAGVYATPVSSGNTAVTFNTGTLGVLTGAGFSIAPIAPGTLTLTPLPVATFPIVGGDTSSVINHSGGLALTRSGTTADLQNFAINVTNNTLFGQVMVGTTTMNNVALFDISSSGGVTNLSLDAALAGAINTVFGVSLPAGTPIGTATITATPEPTSLALMGAALLAAAVVRRRH